MPLTELRKLIKKFKVQKDDTPIALNDQNARCYAIQEVVSICANDIYAFIFFDEHGESELFDALADERTSRAIANKLNDAKLHILTNDTSKVKTLSFVDKHINEGIKNLQVTPIPVKLANEITKDTLDNEFFLVSPEHLIFMGRYKRGDSSALERLAEISAFLNFYDEDFYGALQRYFHKVEKRAKSGEFR
ncbi:hypothetical protein BST55_22580 [Vibrio vulnificus]|uniref:hypothetical protein n=1 Tax=Vibrio vulnificus TaxID=672 RepID=UPI000B9FE660|nr:hypothetical protein [Vibrio vulnificus]MDG2809632.1 hypothetical protein [Vibrio parahaemolyticus]EGR8992372.1 hypothetical protein [Vibrio vulnificus]MCU8566665.1 hypothetical protein [Vibrio vulnificus]OZS51063.1 hypothetical protein BST51_22375 [Vibrio vulnificus]OZS55629.1 hypothetical protein BST52_22660 [Vibrio vulnificus]